jgi:two-component sensor histidine kinase
VTDERAAQEEIRLQLEAKELLLRELHHRVKNNLQVVASLLALQSQAIGPDLGLALEAARGRVLSMAMVHELLYRAGASGRVDVLTYAGELGRSLLASYGASLIELVAEGESFGLELDRAIPLGLILQQIVTNAFKHAFPAGRPGRIVIALGAGADAWSVEVRDDGVGFDPGATTGTSLGLRLLPRLVAQLGGGLERRPAAGTSYRLSLPRPEP